MERLLQRGSMVDDALGERMLADFQPPRTASAPPPTISGDTTLLGAALPSEGEFAELPTHPDEDGCHAIVNNDGDAQSLRAQLRRLMGLDMS